MFHRKKIVWLLLLPGMLGILVFYVVPFFGGIFYSVTDGSFENKFVGFDNYLRVWQNPMFQMGLKTRWNCRCCAHPPSGCFLS